MKKTLLCLVLNKATLNLEIPDAQLLGRRFDINAGFIDTIEHVIGNFILDKDRKINDISGTMEIPTRTLQRRLKRRGTNFNELLKKAKEKLQNSSLTIQDISYQLGYSDPTHFTHAFNRWAGMSPSDYRQACISRR